MNLPSLHSYATSVARDQTMTKPHMREDATQEGLIAGWEASKVNASDAYVKKAIRNAIHDCVVRNRSTGSERPSGHHFVTEALPLTVEGAYGPMLVTDVADESTRIDMADAEVPDLRTAVRGAVSALPQDDRLHVYLRFWQGFTARQVATRMGTTEARTAGHWNTKIRPALVAELSHMRSAA